jgi:hypothetical protein
VSGAGVIRGAAAAVGILGLCAGTYWAGTHTAQVVADSSRATVAASAAETWTAKEETVGRTLRLPATLRTVSRPGPLVQFSGVITALPARKGADVNAGDTVVVVAGRPVFAARGSVPAYRTLSAGTTGADVGQLRTFLCGQRVLSACGPSTTFDAATAKAVTAWHRRHGLTGASVELGELMWFPDLPLRLAAAAKTGVGTQVAATDRPLDVVSGTVRVEVKLTRDQASLVPQGSKAGLGTVHGVSGAPTAVADGTDAMLLPLLSPDGTRQICAPAKPCRALLDGAVTRALDVSIEVIPRRTGIGVPTKAIQTGADGETYVLGEDGRHLTVTELQTAGGMVLVEGIPAGTRILLSANG